MSSGGVTPVSSGGVTPVSSSSSSTPPGNKPPSSSPPPIGLGSGSGSGEGVASSSSSNKSSSQSIRPPPITPPIIASIRPGGKSSPASVSPKISPRTSSGFSIAPIMSSQTS